MSTERILDSLNKKHIWDEQPVFCFTSDIDWASEAVMETYFNLLKPYNLKTTLFCTHESKVIGESKLDKGIHPNFLPRSTQSKRGLSLYAVREYYEEIIQNCQEFAPGSKAFRSHRAFDVTDTNHLLKEKYGFDYCSNYITQMQNGIKPVLHESGLINFPVFFEDGTHLYNKLDLDFRKYINQFTQPGIKIISFHPMNFVLNSPSYKWMRELKDSMSATEYQSIGLMDGIRTRLNYGKGIQGTIFDIINFVKLYNHPIYSLKELYQMI